jgi:hypothetical protein
MIRDSALATGSTVAEAEGGDGHPSDRSLEDAVRILLDGRGLPSGSMVFLLSDFLTEPGELWHAAIARGWDLVPVVIQDPLWERTFPEVSGTLLPLADPSTGRLTATRLSAGEVRARRRANEERFVDLLERFAALGLDAVVVSASDRGHVYSAFLDWAYGRHRGARVAR